MDRQYVRLLQVSPFAERLTFFRMRKATLDTEVAERPTIASLSLPCVPNDLLNLA